MNGPALGGIDLDDIRTEYHWKEALPLRRPAQPAAPFPTGVLEGVLADVIREIGTAVQCPEGLAGQSVLAAATLATQAHANVTFDGRVIPISNYFVTVAASGERKSTADRIALRPVALRERELRLDWVEELEAWKADHQAWSRAKDAAFKGKKTRAEIRAEIEALGPEPVKPIEPMLSTDEPTFEGLVKLLADGWPSVGVFSDEGGRFLGGHAMSEDNRLKTAAGLSGLWDGSPIRRTRSGDGNSLLYDRRVSMHLMIQPVVAEQLFSDSLLSGQGLLGRILPAWPDSTMGDRAYSDHDIFKSAPFGSYFARLSGILKSDLPVENRNELVPARIEVTPEAKSVWIQFHDSIESQLGKDGALRPIASLAAKAAEHALRLAGVLSLVNRWPTFGQIGEREMYGGIALADYYVTEALRIHEEAVVDDRARVAESVIEWGLSRGGQFPAEHLYQFGPGDVRTKADAEPVIKMLVEHGLARRLPPGSRVDGKSRRLAWEVRRFEGAAL